MKLAQLEGEIADVRPDLLPLLALQTRQPGNEGGAGSQADDVVGDKITRPPKVQLTDALLEVAKPAASDLFDWRFGHTVTLPSRRG